MITLASHLDTYLQLRHQLGFKLIVPAILLRCNIVSLTRNVGPGHDESCVKV